MSGDVLILLEALSYVTYLLVRAQSSSMKVLTYSVVYNYEGVETIVSRIASSLFLTLARGVS